MMTNEEKYLKEGVGKANFIYAMAIFLFNNLGYYTGTQGKIIDTMEEFFEQNTKPTLTEDERVILRNIHSNEKYKTYKEIGRTTYGSLYLTYNLNQETAIELGELETDITEIEMYNHLFQFIKERRRIFNRGVAR